MEMDKSGVPTQLEGLRPEQVHREMWRALRAQSVRVMDLFRMWDENGDGCGIRAHRRVQPAFLMLMECPVALLTQVDIETRVPPSVL